MASKVPFNISLLLLNNNHLKNMRQVKSLDAFEGSTRNFHPDGLFSIQTFGTPGTDARWNKFGYIELKMPIIHPTVYKMLVQMRAFYGEIMAGTAFAVWDAEVSDFVKSDAITGQTGFSFFMEYWKKIVFEDRPSETRRLNVQVIDKYKTSCELQQVLVMPAGYRDLEFDANGREQKDEINSLYYKLIASSNTITESGARVSPETYNRQRYVIQRTFLEIYETIISMIEGKKKLLLSKVASRRVDYGTRNVITSLSASTRFLNDTPRVTINHTAVGLYQFMKGATPVVMPMCREAVLSKVFASPGVPATLVNAETLLQERVSIPYELYNDWMTPEGLERKINSYSEDSIRQKPITVSVDGKNYYLGLIYRGPDKTYKFLQGISELPKDRLKEHCVPMSLEELFYISTHQKANTYPALVTRYPVAGLGSIYPSFVYLRSTVISEKRALLDDDWNHTGILSNEFPIRGTPSFNSMSPHGSKLAGLVADFDGDMTSLNILYTEEARKEITDYFNSPESYIGPLGTFIDSLTTDTINYVCTSLSGEPIGDRE